MAKPNYGFAKRQRELAKKQKKEEKRLRKTADDTPAADDGMQTAEGYAVPAPADPLNEPPQQ